MNITKEKMLERIREWKGAFDTHPDKMDEWSLCFMEDYKVYDAIRSLVESSGEKASGVGERPRIPSASELPEEWRKQLSAIEGHVCKPDDTCSCYQLADTPNEKCPVHGSGLWPAHCAECGRFLPAPSPGPRYDPDCQCADCRSDRARNGRPTIKPSLTVAPSPAPDDKSTSPDRNGGQDKENAMEKIKSEEFAKELSTLLNKHCVDCVCGTPDFILADFVVECLEATGKMMKRREEWFGRDKTNA